MTPRTPKHGEFYAIQSGNNGGFLQCYRSSSGTPKLTVASPEKHNVRSFAFLIHKIDTETITIKSLHCQTHLIMNYLKNHGVKPTIGLTDDSDTEAQWDLVNQGKGAVYR